MPNFPLFSCEIYDKIVPMITPEALEEIALRDKEIAIRDEKIIYLEEQLAWFKRQIFGKRSERVVANLRACFQIGNSPDSSAF